MMTGNNNDVGNGNGDGHGNSVEPRVVAVEVNRSRTVATDEDGWQG